MQHTYSDVLGELVAHRKSSVDLLNEALNKAIDADMGKLLGSNAGIREADKLSDVVRNHYGFMCKDLRAFTASDQTMVCTTPLDH